MKRTYKVNEIASKIGKTRATVVEWSNQFREFLPIITAGGALKYSEEAIEMFQFISKMKEANKSVKLIKEDLQEMREKAVTTLNKERKSSPPETKSLLPTNPSVPDSPIPLPANNSISELSKETMNLRQLVQHLRQKTETNKTPEKVKDAIDDRNQKVSISSVSGVSALSPGEVTEVSEEDLKGVILTSVKELLSQQYEAVSKDVWELRKRYNAHFEEVAGLSSVFQVLDRKVAELFQQDITSEVIATIDLLNTQLEDASLEVKGLHNTIQTIQQKIKVSEQELKAEILIATKELLDQQSENVMQGVKELRNVIQSHSNKVNEALEQKLRSEMKAVSESLIQRNDALSDKVTELRSLIQTADLQTKCTDGIAEEVSEMRDALHLLTQIVNEELEQKLKSNMTKKEEALNKKYDDILLKLTTQQQVLDRIAKFLGFQVTN
ncbi:MerR family transcriptional regulator [Paenibacillus sp. GCM10023248]|uniref:MerR family transcriptional regulator n=1 Tax=Bacillales TaxID=1385 RepID=UPI002378CCAE|nr:MULTISPECIES: MerR family transcriptional regulator [Bacillales]MDD9269514.1 MerR family transcriptional regulator [Paenibacillus sp. MAHUQ-63]MDR6880869.1 NTP pyrophosphatase (non-canonical NTP hydrolase) [Bacillus sp. 3255]